MQDPIYQEPSLKKLHKSGAQLHLCPIYSDPTRQRNPVAAISKQPLVEIPPHHPTYSIGGMLLWEV